MQLTKHPHWEITTEKVESSIRKIIRIGHPRRIIVFGSYVRNMTHIDSDVDFLVVVRNDIQDTRKESVRIRRALRGIAMPMDIIVVREAMWNRMKDQPGMIYREAAQSGKTVYESEKQGENTGLA